MNQSILLVDYENIGKIELGDIPPAVLVPFFFGASQKSVPKEFLKAALNLRERFVAIDIEGQGKNALDFHIAYYMGEYLTRSPGSPCIILSKDKGFDPLVKHLFWGAASLCAVLTACARHSRPRWENPGARRVKRGGNRRQVSARRRGAPRPACRRTPCNGWRGAPRRAGRARARHSPRTSIRIFPRRSGSRYPRAH